MWLLKIEMLHYFCKGQNLITDQDTFQLAVKQLVHWKCCAEGSPWLPGTHRLGNPAPQGGKKRHRGPGEVRIIAGWTISVTWLNSAETKLPLSKCGVRQPPIRIFMVDLTAVSGAKWIFQGLERLMSWASMNFNSPKFRSLVLKKRKITETFHFWLGEDPDTRSHPSKTEGPSRQPEGWSEHWIWAPWKIQGLCLPA